MLACVAFNIDEVVSLAFDDLHGEDTICRDGHEFFESREVCAAQVGHVGNAIILERAKACLVMHQSPSDIVLVGACVRLDRETGEAVDGGVVADTRHGTVTDDVIGAGRYHLHGLQERERLGVSCGSNLHLESVVALDHAQRVGELNLARGPT